MYSIESCNLYQKSVQNMILSRLIFQIQQPSQSVVAAVVDSIEQYQKAGNSINTTCLFVAKD